MSDGNRIEVLGISGSLRQDSINTAALRAARELAPDEMHVRIRIIEDIPVYNEDVEAEGYLEPVEALRSAISAADAVLFATPEYNSSISGVLKNAVDWASRPLEQKFEGKPIAIMGASPGRLAPISTHRRVREGLESPHSAHDIQTRKNPRRTLPRVLRDHSLTSRVLHFPVTGALRRSDENASGTH